MKKIAAVSLGLLLLAFTVSAAEFIAPDKGQDPNVSTAQSERYENLYAAGATVNINSPTDGDLFVAGGMVSVNGNVQDDLMVAGGNLNLNGTVGGNLRAGGGNVSINSPVGADLLVGGGNVSITQRAAVGGDLVVGGGNVVMDSEVSGKAKIAGGTIIINGIINGNLEVVASEQLTFGPNSEVTGKITYKGVKPAIIKDGARLGTIEFIRLEKRVSSPVNLGKFFAIGTLIKLLALLVAGLVLYYFFRRRIAEVVEKAKANTLKRLGTGFLFLIAPPILAVLLLITVIGYYLAALVLLFWILALVLAAIMSLFYLGNLVYGWYDKNASHNLIRDLIVGAILGIIITFIPFIGWLALLVVYLVALGAVVNYCYSFRE